MFIIFSCLLLYSMSSGKLKILGLRACLTAALATTIFIANPTHSHIVQLDTAANKLCADERLYYQETRKCYPAQKKGPCGELMVLEPSNNDKNIGECNCESIICTTRPAVFWKQESRCYYIYDQGPCKKGEWVVPHKDAAPSCENITCPDRYNAQIQDESFTVKYSPFVFPNEGECYQTSSQESSPCPAKQRAYFVDSLNFLCGEYFQCGFISIPDKDCPDHSAPDFQGGCEPVTVL